jgi:hypothetical protein
VLSPFVRVKFSREAIFFGSAIRQVSCPCRVYLLKVAVTSIKMNGTSVLATGTITSDAVRSKKVKERPIPS